MFMVNFIFSSFIFAYVVYNLMHFMNDIQLVTALITIMTLNSQHFSIDILQIICGINSLILKLNHSSNRSHIEFIEYFWMQKIDVSYRISQVSLWSPWRLINYELFSSSSPDYLNCILMVYKKVYLESARSFSHTIGHYIFQIFEYSPLNCVLMSFR